MSKEIDASLVQDIVNYLVQQPYKDVAPLLQRIQAAAMVPPKTRPILPVEEEPKKE